MKFRSIMSVSFLALAVSATPQAHALATSTPVMICNNCGNPVIQQRLRDEFGTYSTQYVLDLDRGFIRRFARHADRTWSEIAVEDAERNYFNILMELYSKTGTLFLTDYQMMTGASFTGLQSQPISKSTAERMATTSSDFDGISAWDVANSGAPREKVVAHLNATQDSLWVRLAGNAQMAVGSLRMLFGVDNPADVRLGVRELAAQVHVTFGDGSTSKFAWDPYAKTFAYVPKSSRDSDSNIIPDTADEVTGGNNSIRQYDFSGTPGGVNNAVRFNQRVMLWNVSSPAASAPAVLVCTQVDSGPRYCRLQQ
ncbi:hypothetical protein RKE25_20630 [Dyella sp. BiH032]|uniref:hypothetical protein n=1 Tax=Dyella sp. BiH032 TaxID=3075430 RepID=UPI002892FF97|nr:hypothetical protein [Dyella sp. BiH032]WNL45788.1 hypothetical protein RKE25_20630 [Dyella sp. BiH032]